MAELFVGCTTGRRGFEKVVAIKRILPQMESDEASVQMFFDEARISAHLVHTNIAHVFDLGMSDGAPFIAMEYVHGVSLATIIAHITRRGRLASPSLAAYVLEKVNAALGHAHNRRDEQGRPLGIVHRDVSPSNVLCSFEGEVKLIDFGIAKAARRLQHTRTGYLKGKLAYMSPEQVRGLPVDHRSDIFAAGTLLYVMLTGVNPFRAETDTGTLERELGLAGIPEGIRADAVTRERLGLLDILAQVNLVGHVALRHRNDVALDDRPIEPRLAELGGVTTAELDRIFLSRRDAFRHCQLLSRKRRKIPGGRLVIRLTVAADGSPGEIEHLRDTFEVDATPACLDEQVLNMWFPQPRYGKSMDHEQDFRMPGD